MSFTEENPIVDRQGAPRRPKSQLLTFKPQFNPYGLKATPTSCPDSSSLPSGWMWSFRYGARWQPATLRTMRRSDRSHAAADWVS